MNLQARCDAHHPTRDGYLLAIDVGTTTTRALLFDLAGRPVAAAYRQVRVHCPQPGWAELDADECWQSAIQVLRQVFARRGVPSSQVLGIGLTGLLHALVPVDEQGHALSRAALWMDQRCQAQAEWLAREHGDLIASAMGHRSVTTTPSAPKLRWIVEHDPHLLRRTHKFLSIKDYVRLKLTGVSATDLSDAGGTMLVDRRFHDWCVPLLDAIGVPVEKLAPIRSSTEVLGRVTAQGAACTGLAEGTPISGGGGDTTCTRIGANAEGTGRACLYLGTAAWISAPQRRTGAFAATATTGAALKWLTQLFERGCDDSPGRAYTALLERAASIPPGAAGLLFLPHLMGERGPVPDPEAKGVLFGLSLAHGQAEVTRAVLEGCAFHLRSIVESLSSDPIDEMVIVGGGAKSALWRGIIADVTGTTLLVPEVLEAGALGAAILAGVGVGVYRDARQASDALVRMVERRRPGGDRKAGYDRIYPVYMELEKSVSHLYRRVPVREREET